MEQGAHAAEMQGMLAPAPLPGPATKSVYPPGLIRQPGWSAAAPRAAMPESALLPAPSPAGGLPKKPVPAPSPTPWSSPWLPMHFESSAHTPGAAEPASEEPGFDYMAEKRWNVLMGGTQPYNRTAPMCCPLVYASCQ